MHRKEFARIWVTFVLDRTAVPWRCGDIGDGVVVAAQVFAFAQAAVQHVKLALGLHGEAVDRVFEFLGRIGKEVTKAAAEVGC